MWAAADLIAAVEEVDLGFEPSDFGGGEAHGVSELADVMLQGPDVHLCLMRLTTSVVTVPSRP